MIIREGHRPTAKAGGFSRRFGEGDNMKSCPICKSNNVKLSGEGFNAQIKCLDCGYIRGGFSTKETLISVWNKENHNSKNPII